LPRLAALVAVAAVTLLMAAAGGSSTSAGAGETTRPRPAGPSAAFSDISGGNGVFLGDPIPVNLERAGYVEHEYAASGTATSYTATSPLTEDGRTGHASSCAARVAGRVSAAPSSSSG
jgi:Alpha/beta hydrolase domain